MPAQFTLPPDTRATGTGSPAADMDAVIDAITADGAGLNVLNAAFAGGADPAGVNDSTSAFQACMTAATGTGSVIPGEMLIPRGTYKLNAATLNITGPLRIRGLGPSNGYNSAVTGAVATLPAVTLNCNGGGAGTNPMFSMPSQGYLWGGLEMSGVNISYTGTGNVFDSVNFADSAFRDCTITLTQPGSMVMSCTGSNSVLNVIHERCTFVTTNATRTKPMFSIYSSIGAGISNNTFLKCKFSNAGKDNTQFMVEFGCTGAGSAYHVADNFVECWFEHPYGGVYKSLSGSNIKVDGCIAWDIQGGSPLIGNSLYYFGAFSGNSGSQGVIINGCGRNLNGPDGTSTNKWDVECEATTSGVEIRNYFTTPLAGSPPSTYNIYYNFHGCLDVLVTTSQSPQGSSANGNSSTVITNPSSSQVVVGSGNVTTAGAVALGHDESFSPGDAGLLAWNYDPAQINSPTVPASGTILGIRINIRRPMLVTSVILFQTGAGTTMTTGQCLAGLWDSAGNRIGITADQAANWQSGTFVFKTMALAGGPFTVNPPFVFLLALPVYTVVGSFGWGRAPAQNNATSANAGLGLGSSRWALGPAAQTALPAGAITPGSFFTALQTNEYWAGLS
jgi:hypothetical protein